MSSTNILSTNKVIVCREDAPEDTISKVFGDAGFVVTALPLMRFESLVEVSNITAAIENIDSYGLVAFTSKKAVSIFFEEVHRLHLYKVFEEKFVAGTLSFAVVGEASAFSLEKWGFKAAIIGQQGGADLAEKIAEYYNLKEDLARRNPPKVVSQKLQVLFPRIQAGRDELIHILEAYGAKVACFEIYAFEKRENLEEKWLDIYQNYWAQIEYEEAKMMYIVLTSPKRAQVLGELASFEQKKHLCILSIGEKTSEQCVELGFSNVLTAKSPAAGELLILHPLFKALGA